MKQGSWLHTVLSTVTRHLGLFAQPDSVQNDLASLRLRLIAEAGPHEVGPQERDLANELRLMREQMTRLIEPVEACRTCAKGFPLPNGRWDGGYCCGGTTENVYSQAELASLRASGTDPKDFRTRVTQQAGCVFRGPRGCSVAPAHRPNLCIRYACRPLRDEYKHRGIASEVSILASRIQRTFQHLCTLRDERIEQESIAAMERAIKP